MGRQATGQLIWRKSGWHARFWTVIDGEEIRVCRPLGTTTKPVARRKLARLLASGTNATDVATTPETVEQYATAWLEGREAKGLRSTEYERRHWKQVWQPEIGAMPLASVKAQDIRGVLEAVAEGRIVGSRSKESYSRATLVHIRDTVLRLFETAWRDEIITENPVKRVALPDVTDERPEKARCILTDEEFGMLMQCQEADKEIRLMALMARTIGGMRAGDLVALTWDAFDPELSTCTFVRRKTRRKNRRAAVLEVPAPVRPFLAAWRADQERERAEFPAELQIEPCPVFPVRRGKRAGQVKLNSNVFAARLRRELLKAGVNRPELHDEMATTLPADFHSCRRAFATALARIGMNEQSAMALTGHSDSKVHRRYQDAVTARELPAAAVPTLQEHWASSVPFHSEPVNETSMFSRGRSRDRTCDFDRVKTAIGEIPAENAGTPYPDHEGVERPFLSGSRARCLLRLPLFGAHWEPALFAAIEAKTAEIAAWLEGQP